MSAADLAIVGLYLAVVIGVGIWYQQRAAKDLDAYFLGGKSLPWPALAMSGAVSNFDLTGTMWMVSVMYVLGMQSWWQHWMWGVTMPAFTLAYLARWVRRSRVMTAAEWMRTRFGEDAGGRVARYASAAMAVVVTAAAIGYAFQGIGKFAAVYFPLAPLAARLPVGGEWLVEHQRAVLATAILAVTTLYVVMGGLYSVVVTDVIQTIVLTVAALWIAGFAWWHVSPAEIAAHVPPGFVRVTPSWRLEHLESTDQEAYAAFGFLTAAWVVKGLLLNAGGPAQMYDAQRFLAARTVRDAAKIAAAWPFFLVARWAMVAGITLLALTAFASASDPEEVMPWVLKEHLPAGVRGIVVAGLLAAFMSTFSSTVNAGAAFVVRDLWQPLVRPAAVERHLVRVSYLATVGIVAAGIAIGRQASSIGGIWSWMMMALTAGAIVPNVLRWHWWRMNGWGYAAGIAGGLLLTLVPQVLGTTPDYVLFAGICLGALVASVVVSLATPPTAPAVLAEFRRTVRPFGWWGPVRMEGAVPRGETAGRSLGNAFLAMAGITCLYLAPMYFVGHWYARAAACGLGFAAAALVLWRTWYRHLAEEE
ncbi:MAG: hypothetical protein AB1726_12495 [Planctomycetota bacterium]